MLVATPFNAITAEILGASIEVHRVLGPGLLESIYVECLEFELTARRLRFRSEVVVPIMYKGTALPSSYRIDLIVEELVVVEVKALETMLPVHEAQLLTYMRLTRCPAGLLINFNVARLVEGVTRKLMTK